MVEFEHKLRCGVIVTVSADAESVYRDEFGEAWIIGMEVGLAFMDTTRFVDAIHCLQSEMGRIKTEAEDRLVNAHDEMKMESA